MSRIIFLCQGIICKGFFYNREWGAGIALCSKKSRRCRSDRFLRDPPPPAGQISGGPVLRGHLAGAPDAGPGGDSRGVRHARQDGYGAQREGGLTVGDMSPLLTATDGTKILKCSSQNVYNLTRAGLIQAVVFKTRGNRSTYRYRREDGLSPEPLRDSLPGPGGDSPVAYPLSAPGSHPHLPHRFPDRVPRYTLGVNPILVDEVANAKTCRLGSVRRITPLSQ